MPCFHPLKAFRPLSNADGGRLVFNPIKALNSSNPVTLPCNNCIGCKIDRSRDWAARCTHEASMYEHNSFLTLTYSDEHLPQDYSVNVRTYQLFMKRLRKAVGPTSLRFFACGEYGDQTLRPHYHSLIFNFSFPDKTFLKNNSRGDRLYTSAFLNQVWPYGHAWIGNVTYQSAAYVARYVTKKIVGDRATDHYTRLHPLTGQAVTVQPEFCVQSRNPGIGDAWFQKYKSDAFPSDFIVVDGKQHPVPKFYAKKLAEEELELVKRRRKRNALPRKADSTRDRLAVREEVKLARLSTLKRNL